MNVVRSGLPMIGIVLTVVLSAGIAFGPSTLEAQRPQIRKAPLRVQAEPEPEPAKVYPEDFQDHPGHADRLKKLTLQGDSKVLESVAGHTAIYARYRYGIDDITTEADYERARGEMYDFLSWKYGNPSLVAAQFVSAGYGHFDHHADEAAAALLGMELPGPGAQARLPKELSDWLKVYVDSLANGGEGGVCAQMGDSTWVGFACEKLLPIVQQAIEQSIDRIGISSAALIGKNTYDVTDEEIEFLIEVKRNPTVYNPDPRRRVRGIGGTSIPIQP